MARFIGFSTIGRLAPPYTLTDIDLVKRDLLNEFETRLGERVMQPEFGTIIYDLLMEPGDELTLDAIERDAIRIVQKEPRVDLLAVNVKDYEDAIAIEIDLLYNPDKLRESLYIRYQRTTQPDGSIARFQG